MVHLKSLRIHVLAAVAALGATACADTLDQEAPDSSEQVVSNELAQEAAPTSVALPTGEAITVPNPSGLYIASLRASGSGCPKGSYSASISSDGLVFTILLSKYEIYAKPEADPVQTKNCTLVIGMNSPAGLSFGVSSLSYQGYALLAPGMSATESAYYTFVGGLGSTVNVDGLGIREKSHTISGPADKEFFFTDDVELSAVNYSECGKPASLLVNTRLALRNPRKEDGYVNINAIDNSVETKLVVKLAKRECPKK